MPVTLRITLQEPMAIGSAAWIPEALAVGVIRPVVFSVIIPTMESILIALGR
jgi:hypothetical protein